MTRKQRIWRSREAAPGMIAGKRMAPTRRDREIAFAAAVAVLG